MDRILNSKTCYFIEIISEIISSLNVTNADVLNNLGL